ncbi:MAG: hypothetical protein ACE14W_09565 [Candidatus Velamenicoccus archaeovorus]
MRGRSVVALVVVAVSATAGLASLAGSGLAAETITAYVGDQHVRAIDVGRRGPSAGDDLVVRGQLFADPERTSPLGLVRASCERLDGDHLYCWNETTVDGRGEVISEGTQDLRVATFVDAITGGTGDFATARGTVDVDFATGTLTIAVLD